MIVSFFFALSLASSIQARFTFPHHRPSSEDNDQASAAMEVTRRLLGQEADHFTIKVDAGGRNGEKDTVGVMAVPAGNVTKVTIIGTSGVAVTWGLNHYLKYSCRAHVSWETRQLALPSPLPTAEFTLNAMDRFRYYQNVCTYGYSFVWWGWSQWERHIDWMALNGINLPLAFTGQEEIWRRVYTKLGLTQAELDDHFSGPAFLPWQRMGNLRKWGGPLSSAWHQNSVLLQHAILGRMRTLGMTPILPGFAGHIPHNMTRIYPNITFSPMQWLGFNCSYTCTYLLEPTEPLFHQIGTMFIQEQTEEFGTDHFYAADTFNEMTPRTNDTKYLANVSKAIHGAMTAADPMAVWVMQGWLFLESFWQPVQIKALLTAVPLGQMLLLDLDSCDIEQYTRTHSYYGQPFIFNMLHNFGGQLMLFGRSSVINTRVMAARDMDNSSMVGTGFTPEGIHVSYIIYDLMAEMAWRETPMLDLGGWFAEYTNRRYGGQSDVVQRAWSSMATTVYNFTAYSTPAIPSMVTLPQMSTSPTSMWYQHNLLLSAWDDMVSAIPLLGANSGFQFDLVDVTRQVLVDMAPVYKNGAVTSYNNGNKTALINNSTMYLELLGDLDSVLATNANFMLGPWLEDAKSRSTNADESALYEFNARNQVTLWGPNAEILDYAAKQWSGLVSDYYAPRWKLFFDTLHTCLTNGTKFNQYHYNDHFMNDIGKPFTMSRSLYPSKPTASTASVVQNVHDKWRKKMVLQDPEMHPKEKMLVKDGDIHSREKMMLKDAQIHPKITVF